jgi:DNA-binding NtrC family response regulator
MNNVLLVDDDVNTLNSLKRALRCGDYQVLTAFNGFEALGLLGHTPFAAAVCDLSMPDMSGLQLLRRIKEYYPEVVRIVLTGQSDISLASRAVNEGEVYRFFTKPWDDDELRQAIDDALERFEAQRQVREAAPAEAAQAPEERREDL